MYLGTLYLMFLCFCDCMTYDTVHLMIDTIWSKVLY